MSEKDDDETVVRALEEGAHYVLQWPLTFDKIEILKQQAIRLRMQKLNKDLYRSNMFTCIADFAMKPNVPTASTGVVKEELLMSNEEQNPGEKSSELKGKTCISWTPNLHEKFLNAIDELGEGSKYFIFYC